MYRVHCYIQYIQRLYAPGALRIMIPKDPLCRALRTAWDVGQGITYSKYVSSADCVNAFAAPAASLSATYNKLPQRLPRD